MYTTDRARQTQQTLSRKHKLPGTDFPADHDRRHISTSANAEGPFGDNVDLTFDNCSVYFCAYAFVSLSSVLWYGNPSFPTLSRCPWSKSIPNRSYYTHKIMRWLQLRFDFDSTGVRRGIDCLSKIIKVTLT